MNKPIDRRTFLKATAILGGGSLVSAWGSIPTATPPPLPKAQVAFVKTTDRAAGVKQALALLNLSGIKGKSLFLKPNFNSADPAPGSTHSDTLRALVQALQTAGAARLTVGDRSGMGDTRRVMSAKGIFTLADELGFDTLVFDELPATEWVRLAVPDGHWRQGFALPRPVLEAQQRNAFTF